MSIKKDVFIIKKTAQFEKTEWKLIIGNKNCYITVFHQYWIFIRSNSSTRQINSKTHNPAILNTFMQKALSGLLPSGP